MSSIELEKTEEIAKDLGEPKPKRKYVKKIKVVEVDLTPQDSVVVAEEKTPALPKEKKPRSEAQQKAFERCLESKRIKTAQRKEERKEEHAQLQEQKKMQAEDKIVKTGIKLQKRALIQLAIEEGDDIDIPDEIVKKVLKRRASKKQPAKDSAPSRPAPSPPQSPSKRFTFVDN